MKKQENKKYTNPNINLFTSRGSSLDNLSTGTYNIKAPNVNTNVGSTSNGNTINGNTGKLSNGVLGSIFGTVAQGLGAANKDASAVDDAIYGDTQGHIIGNFANNISGKGIKNITDQIKADNVGSFGSTDDIMKGYNSLNFDYNFKERTKNPVGRTLGALALGMPFLDFSTNKTKFDLNNTKAAAEGAQIGSVGGPWGALAGVMVGGTLEKIGDMTVNKRIDAYNEALRKANEQKNASFVNSLNNFKKDSFLRMQANNGINPVKYGGMINKYKEGGIMNPYFDTFGSNAINYLMANEQLDLQKQKQMINKYNAGGSIENPHGIIEYNAGGTHSQNPRGGVPISLDPLGVPNAVEEGELNLGKEIIPNGDFILSHSLIAPKEIAKSLGVKSNKKMTFADLGKEIKKEAEERPNDAISKRALKTKMRKLAQAQEMLKQQQEQEALALGLENPEVNSFKGGGFSPYLPYLPYWSAKDSSYVLPEILIDPKERKKSIPYWNDKDSSYVLPDVLITPDPKPEVLITSDLKKREKGIPYWYSKDGPYKSKYPLNYLPYINFHDANLNDFENNYLHPFFTDGVTKTEQAEAYNKLIQRSRLGEDYYVPSNYTFSRKQVPVKKEEQVPVKEKETPDLNRNNITIPIPNENKPSKSTKKGGISNYTPVNDRTFNTSSTSIDDINLSYLNAKGSTKPTDPIELDPELVKRARQQALDTYNAAASEKEDDGLYQTWSRYVPAFGSALGLALAARPADYSNVDIIKKARENGKITPTYIGDYIQENPLDREYLMSQMMSQGNATRRAIRENAAGNRANANASLLANDYATQLGMGEAFRQGDLYNRNDALQVAEFNRGTNSTNAEADRAAQVYNNSNNLKLAIAEAEMREKIDNARAAAIAGNLTNLFQSIGNIGKENFAFNQINKDRSNLYKADRKGDSHYVTPKNALEELMLTREGREAFQDYLSQFSDEELKNIRKLKGININK